MNFMQRMNEGLKSLYPDAMLIAEDSTSFPGTTKPASQNGLGFDYKWDLGWMNDTLKYMSEQPADRGRDIGKLLFSMEYFFNETYLLPLSHDEVVHGKGTIVNKMAGDFDTRLQQARLLYLYMFTHPGKKLNFMGNELARTREWDEKIDLDWEALNSPVHSGFQAYFRRLNDVYLKNPALWQDDYEKSSFRWNRKAEGEPQSRRRGCPAGIHPHCRQPETSCDPEFLRSGSLLHGRNSRQGFPAARYI